MPILPRLRFALALAVLASTTGCGHEAWQSTATSNPAAGFSGYAHGGQQPVASATVQLYAVGTASDGSASTALLATPVMTDANGNFNVGTYSCGNATEVYITATGGNPGEGGNNANLALMAALGPCAGLAGTTVNIDELTTVAAVYALSPYMSSLTSIGSSTGEAASLAAAFTLATEMVNTSTGLTPGVNLPAGATDPVALIDTLGNIIAACVNTTGGAAGSSTICGSLFTLATPDSATAPTNTVAALLNIANHPTSNVTALFNLANSDSPFQPTLSSAPVNLEVSLIPAGTVTRAFYAFPESDDTVTPLYTLVNSATKTIDMTMYELVDTTFSGDLVTACKRGVVVRVILDQNDEKSSNTAAYNQLNAQANCSAVWANPAFQVTHEKSFIVDGTTLALLTLNLTSRYYSSTRDFAVVYNDPVDIAAVEATFNADYNSTVDYTYSPIAGNDLIWSPTTAKSDLLAMIDGAQHTLLVENEEMSASTIVTAFENACKRGVTLNITMTNDENEYETEFNAIDAACTTTSGTAVHVYPYSSSTSVLYIHGKAILADYGTSTATAYVGSINFSNASLIENRELGMYVSDAATMQSLNTTMTADYSGATAY